jgi:hypothetical protein
MINSLEITAEVGGFVEYSADLYSKIGESAGTLTPSYLVDKSFTAKDVKVRLADSEGQLNAGTDFCVKSVSLTVEKELEPDDCLGSSSPADILNKVVRINGSLELLYEANTYKDLALAGANKAMRIKITSPDTIGAGTTPYSLQFDLAKVSFDWSKETGDDLSRQTLEFKALYSLTDGKMIDVELVNATASY